MTDTPPEWSAEAAIVAAAAMIERAGFDLKYTSPSGSRYYHLSSRVGGALRLAGHAKEKADGTVAMLTIHAAHMPRGEEKLRMMVARTIGWYLLETEQAPAKIKAFDDQKKGVEP